SFPNRYTSTSVAAEPQMRADLGDHFDRLFTRQQTTKLRDGAMDEIKALLGDKFDALMETVETVVPKPEFRQNVHDLRAKVDGQTAAKLDEYEVAFCCKPS